MNYKSLFSAALLVLALGACRKPQPLDIAIPQGTERMVISSNVVNEHLIIVSAGYSIRSTASPDAGATDSLPVDMLVDSAIITITAPNEAPVTLHKLSPGIFSTSAITLKPDTEYQLTVTDCKKGLVATASTTYVANTTPISVSTNQVGPDIDSLLKINVLIDEITTRDYYFVSYSTVAQLRKAAGGIKFNASNRDLAALVSFESKRIQLFDNSMARQNKLEGSLMTKAGKGDTLLVQVAKIDKAYYEYLAAYKRTGYFINQLSGEPINLPSNINNGYGYFALYRPKVLFLNVTTGQPL